MVRTIKAFIAVMVLLTFVPHVMASDDAAPSPFAGDLGNAVWTLVIFALVLVVLGKFAWGPILKGLQSREDFISKSIHDADGANKKAQELLAQYKEQLNQARTEATAIVEEGRRDAEEVKRTIHEDTRKEAEAMVARAKQEVELAHTGAVRELYSLSATLATEVAGKIIGRELNASDHERLVEESIAALGQSDARRN